MLESLFIRNLVLVPELQLSFGKGFLTVTGETGAGKSLILGALRLLGGARANASLIRHGAKSCEVAGAFLVDGCHAAVAAEIDEKLEELALPPREEGRLLLRRVVSESGSRAFVNGSPVTAAILREFGDMLVDIHGPNESHSLLSPSRQLRLLDLYCGDQKQLECVRAAWSSLSSCRKSLDELRNEGLAPEEQELLRHQLSQIEGAGFSPGEEEKLLADHRVASNGARLRELSESISYALGGADSSVTDALVPLVRQAEELAQLDPAAEKFLERINAASNDLMELSGDLNDYGEGLDLDMESLQEMEARIDLIQKFKRRYGPTLEDAIETGSRIRQRLEKASEREGLLKELTERSASAAREHTDACRRLSEIRRKASTRLADAITAQLQKLGFQKAVFQVKIEDAQAGPGGADALDFLFAPNQGEPIAPLRQIASSGEVARVMLAIKTVLSEVDDLPILVFDEIDANIGGKTAGAVAEELHSLGRIHQVFSITHLPLIAAAGDRQYLVEKQLDGDRTVTTMKELAEAERVAEITRMLGADSSDATALAHAREMLRTAGGATPHATRK